MTTAPKGRTAASKARPPADPAIEGQELGWQGTALCRGSDVNLFFAPNTAERKEDRLAREAAAKAICARCPVQAACLEFALATREAHGIWGGLNETERRAARSRRAG